MFLNVPSNLLSVLSNSVIFAQADPFEVSEYLKCHVGHHVLEPADSTCNRTQAAFLNHRNFADCNVSFISYGEQVNIRCFEPRDVYHFQFVVRGECRWRFQDKNIRMLPGQALMVNAHDEVSLSYSDDCEKVIIAVPQALINEICFDKEGSLSLERIIFSSEIIDLSGSICFMKLLDALLTEAEDSELLGLEHVERLYCEILIRKLLQQFSNNATSKRDLHTIARSYSKILAYIEANIRADLSVEELAQVGNVSKRTIYNLFAKYSSMTPKLFIKKAKLRSLHKELTGGKAIRNVTEVALNYGFTHLGRFSSDYRKMFGELPSETFRRRR
ncbi:MAG: AraC family transcriptional regulator [Pseudoalteromonas sp.]|nr:AraC family transcriptional regulator [Pseudoalteromonas sp.]